MSNIFITIRKELRSILRDKKTIMVLMMFPLLIPVMIFLYAYIYEGAGEESKYLIGVDYSLNTTEKSIMTKSNLDYNEYKSKKEMGEAYKRGDILGYIDYNKEENKYYLYTNEDSEDGMYVSSYATAYFEGYNDYLAKLRLVSEDIDVDSIYDNFSYDVINLEGENFILNMMFTISFTYIVMAIVMSTTNMATTATAVERENGTLETILTFPIRLRDLIVGKYLATVIIGIMSAVIGLGLTIGSLVIATNSFEVFRDINFSFSIVSILIALLVVVLASLFIAGLSMAVTSFAKTYKEAQSISSALNMITVIPMFVSILGMEISSIYYVLPILNYTQVLMDIFSGSIDIIPILLVVISSVIYALVVIVYILKRYRTERVLFG